MDTMLECPTCKSDEYIAFTGIVNAHGTAYTGKDVFCNCYTCNVCGGVFYTDLTKEQIRAAKEEV